ncbi:MAG: rhamnogalacturonan acetylesterase [Planctomycetales bacterium]|nr:rhamnogalacturonan acetylesterase [Planctomycetales bacterium]
MRNFTVWVWMSFCAPATIANASNLPTIHIAGDSTAANGSDNARGWGRHLAEFFDAQRVAVKNHARGGRSSRTFITEGHWQGIIDQLQPGDVVLIQFGHNDGGKINDPRRARGSLRGLGDETEEIDNQQTGQHEVVHSFGWYMRKMISETEAKGAFPVLLSLTVRNIWNDGHVERGSGRYGEWTGELAKSENVPLIDLTALIADEYERRGQEQVGPLFPRDHTHTGDEGALLNARLVVEGLKGLREEQWNHWLSATGRNVARAAPRYVSFPKVNRGTTEAAEQRFLNTTQRADDTLPTLWLIGDSTVRTGRGRGEGGQFGWGDPLQGYFDQSRINVVNRAMGGTGARTFRTGGFWQPVLEQIQPGDVVIMQFGHNDNGKRGAMRGTGDETEERTLDDGSKETVETFGAYLCKFVAEIRDKQATPIVCSLIPRKIWNVGKIQRTDDGHAAWARQVASEQDVMFIDLHERVASKYDEMGPEAVDAMFADQRVHTSYEGAVLNASCVMEGLKDLPDQPLREYMR